jgi:hypothetical protein
MSRGLALVVSIWSPAKLSNLVQRNENWLVTSINRLFEVLD